MISNHHEHLSSHATNSLMSHTDEDMVDSHEEGLQLLLGGLSSKDMVGVLEWPERDPISVTTSLAALQLTRVTPSARQESQIDLSKHSILPDQEEIFKNAHAMSPQGCLIPPAVQIVDFGIDRGHGLVATSSIRKGDVLLVERAVVTTASSTTLRLCIACCKSLVTCEDVCPGLPESHLWPQIANCCIKCDNGCTSLFCSYSCKTSHFDLFGNCCRLQRCVDAARNTEESATTLGTMLFVIAATRTDAPFGPAINKLCGDATDITVLELGIGNQKNDGDPCYSLEGLYIQICHILQLSSEDKRKQELLSLSFFSTLCSISARNGIGGTTASTFSIYYSSLLRATGGRGTKKHEKDLQHLVIALSSGKKSSPIAPTVKSKKHESAVLTRSLNAEILEQTTPQFAGIFALTARINHSCQPNLIVETGGFVDAHLQLVALRDVDAGQELTISYLPPNQSNRTKRQRALRAKYMFDCSCPLCTS